MTESEKLPLLSGLAEVARREQLQLAAEDISEAAFAELSEQELQALASSVSERLSREPAAAPGRRSTAAQPGGWFGRRLAWLAAAAAVLGASLWLRQLAVPASDRASVEVAAIGDRRLSLPDGSTLALAEQTEARVVALSREQVRVQLDRGSVECEVAHDPGRRFVVLAGEFEVVVKGTRFTISSGPGAASSVQVAVSVERGLVEVRQPPDRVLALLGAGQRWSSDGPGVLAPATLVEPEELRPEPAPKPQRVDPVPPRPPAPQQIAALSARSLFERADAARSAGRAHEAAAAFDELRRRYPADARAGYAAFMLGRIRLDTLNDPGGAAEAFAFAIAHPGSGFFLEDAEARRVEALAKAGRTDECRRARDPFLASYPQAVRGPFVAQLCRAPD